MTKIFLITLSEAQGLAGKIQHIRLGRDRQRMGVPSSNAAAAEPHDWLIPLIEK